MEAQEFVLLISPRTFLTGFEALNISNWIRDRRHRHKSSRNSTYNLPLKVLSPFCCRLPSMEIKLEISQKRLKWKNAETCEFPVLLEKARNHSWEGSLPTLL